MKVGDQRIHRADLVARQDEQPGFTGVGLQLRLAGCIDTRCRFQRTHHRGAHSDHATTSSTGVADLCDQAGADVEPFTVHDVLVETVGAHRLKGAGTHVQGEVAQTDAAPFQGVQQRVVEMQAGGRRGDGTDLACIYRLVTLVVIAARLALDIGRQRQAAGVQQPALQRLRNVEAQPVELAFAAEHLGLAAGIQCDPRPGLGRFADAQLRARLIGAEQALDQDLDAAAGRLGPEQARRDHPGVVEHQKIPGRQQLGQFAKNPIFKIGTVGQRRRRRGHHQQPARGTLG